MPATTDNTTLTVLERYQLKATLQNLAQEREELELEEIVSVSGVPSRKVRAVMTDLDADPHSPVVEVDDGVWWTRI